MIAEGDKLIGHNAAVALAWNRLNTEVRWVRGGALGFGGLLYPSLYRRPSVSRRWYVKYSLHVPTLTHVQLENGEMQRPQVRRADCIPDHH